MTPTFSFARFERFWSGETKTENPPNGESLDQYTGYLSLEYGLFHNFAADAAIGYTATESKAFGGVSDSGLGDTSIGLRYRLLDEEAAFLPFMPTVAIRAGGIIAGTYDENAPFPTGDGAHAFEASLLAGKMLFSGIGFFGEAGYRTRGNDVPDDLIGLAGFFATFKSFTATVAYRHIEALSGPDLSDPGFGVSFGFPQLKEINQNLELSIGYRDSGGRFYQIFYARTLAGRNTGEKDIFGILASFSIGP